MSYNQLEKPSTPNKKYGSCIDPNAFVMGESEVLIGVNPDGTTYYKKQSAQSVVVNDNILEKKSRSPSKGHDKDSDDANMYRYQNKGQ